ncbi:hypothetical protein MLD38_009641 [Melastoma candidum]|uniref:Uncharacterized protein n=1 Tax=Melastoma candidum TaxID=119954 RepID=A0ACB9RY59_9MYRT|nr:hypothetical protein MLD38_009641 [Melastoma candidum]
MHGWSGKQLLVIASLLVLAASKDFFTVVAESDAPRTGAVQEEIHEQARMVGGTKTYKPPSGPNPRGNRRRPRG